MGGREGGREEGAAGTSLGSCDRHIGSVLADIWGGGCVLVSCGSGFVAA